MKNLIKLKWLLLVLGAFIFENNMNAQGCVAVRATGCSGTTNSSTLLKNQLEFTTNFRYFESHRHFVGDVEQKEREERRYFRQKEFVETLMKDGALLKALTLVEARDILWTFTGRDIYRMLVVERGWSSDRYEKWLAELLATSLLTS